MNNPNQYTPGDEGDRVFLTLSQKSASKAFYEAFLAELDAIGVPFEVMRSEPLHLCGVRYDGLEGVKL